MNIMSTLIVYATSKGYVEECVGRLKNELGDDAVSINRKRNRKDLSLDDYDTVIIGGSIHASNLQRSIKKFCSDYLNELLTKKVGLFLCCLETDKPDEYIKQNVPADLQNHAQAVSCFGGRLEMKQQNIFMRAMLKKISGSSDDQHREQFEEIPRFVQKLGLQQKGNG
jgi:menaquinone-dependent protoporphyrinogen oxidase